MNGHSGDIAAAVMIGAAIMLALVLSAKADALSAQPSQIIHELRQQQTGKQAKPLQRLARTPDQFQKPSCHSTAPSEQQAERCSCDA